MKKKKMKNILILYFVFKMNILTPDVVGVNTVRHMTLSHERINYQTAFDKYLYAVYLFKIYLQFYILIIIMK